MNYPDGDCEDWASLLIGGPHYPTDDAHILAAYGPGGDYSEDVREDVRDGSMAQTKINGHAFRGDGAYNILDVVREQGPITARAVAEQLGVNYHTVKNQLKRLRAARAVDFIIRMVPYRTQTRRLYLWTVEE